MRYLLTLFVILSFVSTAGAFSPVDIMWETSDTSEVTIVWNTIDTDAVLLGTIEATFTGSDFTTDASTWQTREVDVGRLALEIDLGIGTREIEYTIE